LAMVFPWVASRLGSAVMLKHKAARAAALSKGALRRLKAARKLQP
jgi:hypothetical protein